MGGIANLNVETATNSILERNSEAWRFYEYSQEIFGEDEAINVAVEAKKPFSPQLFERVAELTAEFERLRDVRRVDSLSTLPLIRTIEDGSVSLEPPVSPSGRLRVQPHEFPRMIRKDRVLRGTVISEDGRTAGINLLVREGRASNYPQLVERVRSLVASDRAWVSGVPVFRVETDRRSRRELAIFFPVAALLMVILVRIAFGSWGAVLAAVLPGLVGTSFTLGMMGYSGKALSVTSILLPPVLLALSTAYMMHLLVAVAVNAGRAQVRAVASVLTPVGISAATTAVGFLAVSLVPVDSVRTTGLMGALGAITVGTACVVGGPALVGVFNVGSVSNRRMARVKAVIPALSGVVARRRMTILLFSGVLILIAGFGLSQLEVGTDVTRWFPRESPVRRSWDVIGERLAGLTPVNVVVGSNSGTLVTTPEAFGAIEKFTAELEAKATVGRALAFTDPVRELGESLNEGGLPSTFPERKEVVEQYLLVLESVKQISDLVSEDRSAANVLVRANDNNSAAIRELADFSEEWWVENGVGGMRARATGTMFEFARAEDAIAHGQLRGFGYAVLGVALILIVWLRDVRAVVGAVVANFAPIAVAFGFVGLLGVRLDAGMVLVGSIAIGIAVDDTIHVMAAYNAASARYGPFRDRVQRVLGRIFVPILLTTIAVAGAFGVLAFSEFTFIRNLGVLTALVMVLCLLTDVLWLPGLLETMGWGVDSKVAVGMRRKGCADKTGPGGA